MENNFTKMFANNLSDGILIFCNETNLNFDALTDIRKCTLCSVNH